MIDAHFDKGTDDAQTRDPQVFVWFLFALRVEERIQKERDVGFRHGSSVPERVSRQINAHTQQTTKWGNKERRKAGTFDEAVARFLMRCDALKDGQRVAHTIRNLRREGQRQNQRIDGHYLLEEHRDRAHRVPNDERQFRALFPHL